MSLRRILYVGALVGAVLGGCGDGPSEGATSSAPESASSVESAVAPTDGSGGRPVDEAPESAGAPAVPELPAEIPPLPARAAFQMTAAGGTLVAGALSLDVPPRALSEATAVSVEVLASAEALGRPLPGSLALGAYRAEPWNPQLSRAIRITVPLSRELAPGTPVELLAWHPQMATFIVAGISRVDASGGGATFAVRQLGDMIVRATPIPGGALDACPGDDFSLREAWPAPSEDDVVGLTSPEDRTPRSIAFSLLTDFRLAPAFPRVEFKNEEMSDGLATRADERNHRDEDFLMDPNAAAALTALVALAEREWIDPLTGRPAVRVRVTEAYDSLIEHSPQSTHYQGRAIDLTTSPVPPADGASRRAWYGRLSRLAVCAGFDWVLFENQAHVHASVRPTEIALASADGEGIRVSTSDLRRPRHLRPTGQRWEAAPEGIVGFRWSDRGRFELVAEAAGAAPVDGGPLSAQVSNASFTTVDGMRRIVVTDGRAYLVNTAPVPPLGSTDADGTPVDVEYPLPVSPPDEFVRSASFREHPGTQSAFERHVLGPR